ncbi:hypothetical protein J2X53_004430 [Pseudorhodobacter sp. 4114]|nr:hypothetical protein [Pseudorhodobacter sp. 4114]
MGMSFYDDTVGPDDQQPPQGTLAHLRHGYEALLSPSEMF